MGECKFLDHHCPCQDGDACHYEDVGGTKAWPVPAKRALRLVATPLPEGAMECSTCDHIETDAIFLDTETCSMCGGLLTAVDFDDD